MQTVLIGFTIGILTVEMPCGKECNAKPKGKGFLKMIIPINAEKDVQGSSEDKCFADFVASVTRRFVHHCANLSDIDTCICRVLNHH